MTSGTRTSGSQGPITTNSGTQPNFRQGYYLKSWSGTDYPNPHPNRPKQGGYVSRPRFVEAWAGDRKVTLNLGERKFPIPRHPPPRGSVVEHPYNCDIEFENQSVYSWFALPGPGTVNTRTSVQDGGTCKNPIWKWIANDDIALLGKLRNGVAGSDFNLGVFLGEGVKALDMMAGAASGIFQAYGMARKGNFVGAAGALLNRGDKRQRPGKKVVANNWLELQYGWLPLVNDVYEGAIFLSHHLNVPLQKVIKVIRRQSGHSFSVGNTFAWSFTEVKVRESKQLKAILREKDVVQLSGLLDPLSVLWELLPYSFIIDWFIPVGNYLAGRGLASSIEGTFVTSYYRLFDSGPPTLKSHLRYNSGTNGFRYKKILLDRSVSTSLSVPFPTVKPLGDVPSWKRAANGIALGIQKFR